MRFCSDCSELHLRHPLITVHQAPTRGDRDLSDKDDNDSGMATDFINEDDLEDHMGNDMLNTGLWEDDSSQDYMDTKDSSDTSEGNGADVGDGDKKKTKILVLEA